MRIILILLIFAHLTSACTAAIIGTATATTIASVASRQDRTFGTIVDDTIIKAKIKNQLRKAESPGLFFKVSAKSVDGSVVLTGVVNDPKLKVDAVKAAWSVPGVKAVADEIQISDKGHMDSYVKDSTITIAAKSKMVLNKYIRSVNYTIVTVKGTVYVIGIARSQDELDIVMDTVSRVSGVKKVVSYAEVRPRDDERG